MKNGASFQFISQNSPAVSHEGYDVQPWRAASVFMIFVVHREMVLIISLPSSGQNVSRIPEWFLILIREFGERLTTGCKKPVRLAATTTN